VKYFHFGTHYLLNKEYGGHTTDFRIASANVRTNAPLAGSVPWFSTTDQRNNVVRKAI